MMNWHGLDVYRRFKWTTKVLVKRAGGSSKAAEIIGMRNRQNVERWYLDDGDNETRSIPLFALLDLESEAVEKCGAPVLIPALAKEFGYR
ncbi:hypothetical protein, partial [Breoghania sp. JC706]|uniref:hypothetical protein n=1 Tax=Breoghania sp. JC706 TaxID=3117732 RepID=UPI00300877EA